MIEISSIQSKPAGLNSILYFIFSFDRINMSNKVHSLLEINLQTTELDSVKYREKITLFNITLLSDTHFLEANA